LPHANSIIEQTRCYTHPFVSFEHRLLVWACRVPHSIIDALLVEGLEVDDLAVGFAEEPIEAEKVGSQVDEPTQEVKNVVMGGAQEPRVTLNAIERKSRCKAKSIVCG